MNSCKGKPKQLKLASAAKGTTQDKLKQIHTTIREQKVQVYINLQKRNIRQNKPKVANIFTKESQNGQTKDKQQYQWIFSASSPVAVKSFPMVDLHLAEPLHPA